MHTWERILESIDNSEEIISTNLQNKMSWGDSSLYNYFSSKQMRNNWYKPSREMTISIPMVTRHWKWNIPVTKRCWVHPTAACVTGSMTGSWHTYLIEFVKECLQDTNIQDIDSSHHTPTTPNPQPPTPNPNPQPPTPNPQPLTQIQ